MTTLGTVPTRAEFAEQTARFRPELTAHCYRMLGSPHDAEDLVQETYLRAWQAYDGFEGRSSLRTWLYRIATSCCLRALENRDRRLLPSGTGPPSRDPHEPAHVDDALRWIGPVPDAWLATGDLTGGDRTGGDLTGGDPAAAVALRQSVRLALVAALQQLPARQRVVLLLRDVVQLSAAEVAELLDTTSGAVHSALQRARAQLAQVAPTEEDTTEPAEPETRRLLDRYAGAFERADFDALTRLLRADVELEMPPIAAWFAGRDPVVEFIATRSLAATGELVMIPTRANGQPAFVVYRRAADGVLHAHGIQVLTVTPTGISRIVMFLDPGLVTVFGRPEIDRSVDEPRAEPRP